MPFLTTLSTMQHLHPSINLSHSSSWLAIPTISNTRTSTRCLSNTITCFRSSHTASHWLHPPPIDFRLLQTTSNQLNNNSKFNTRINRQWRPEVQIHIYILDHIRIFRSPPLTFHNYNNHSNWRRINWDSNKWLWFPSNKFITSRVRLCVTTAWTMHTT